MVYKSTKDFIREHYGRYGLDANLIQYLEELPRQLHLRLGKGEDFWQEELENCQSKIHELDLINGGIRYALPSAIRGRPIQTYATTSEGQLKETGF
jgi:hypothetical protein